MSPIEYIAEGIRQGNWKTVCEGYKRLTGNALPIPVVTLTTNDAWKEEALTQIMNIIASIPKSSKKKPGRPKNNNKKRIKKKKIIVPDREDTSLQLNDNNKTIIQRETNGTRLITNNPDPEEIKKNKIKAKRAGRNKLKLNRQTAETYKVKCNECEEFFQSNRPKGEIGQKCPKCLNDLRGRFV